MIVIARYNYNKNINTDNYDPLKEENFTQNPLKTIRALYKYQENTHTLIGEIELPNPCYEINTNISKEGNETEIEITKQMDTDMMCAQVITSKRFRVDFEGERDDLIIASLDGDLVNLNIFEFPADEDLEKAEFPKPDLFD